MKEIISVIDKLRESQKKLAAASLSDICEVLEELKKVLNLQKNRKMLLEKLPEITGFSKEMCEEGLCVLSEILTGDFIEKRIRGEFKNPDLLSESVRDPQTGLLLRATPLGVVLHVAPGNVFLGIADSIVMAFITKNASLVKLSSRDTFFPLFFKKALDQADKKGLLSGCLEFFSADHDSPDLYTACQNTDGILFWGGAEALKKYQEMASVNSRMIFNGPRFSFCVLEEKEMADTDYEGLARDIVMWEQQACSSPQVIYLFGDQQIFSDRLRTEISLLLQKYPPGEISIDEQIEIRRERERGRIEALEHDETPLFSDRENYSVIRLYKESIRTSPHHRTVFLKKVKSVDQVLQALTPYRSYLQTAGICLSEKYASLSEKLLYKGAMRVVHPGDMCSGVPGAPHDGRYLLSELVNLVSQKQSQKDKLSEIVRFASANSPYYKKIIRPGMNFSDIPFLERQVMQKISPPLSEDILTGPLKAGFYFCSGGTTGSPKYSFYSNEDYHESTDVLADIFRSAGVDEHDRVANVFIAGNLWTSFLVVNQALINIGCINLPIGGNGRIEDIAEAVSRFEATALVGLPSIIVSIAEVFREKKLKSAVRTVLYGGEHMSEEAIAFLGKYMGVKSVRSAGYAIVDSGPIGVQCRYLKGSQHHSVSQYNYIELIMDGKQVSDGEAGEIVVTNLSRRLMPVIRFRTGDLGRKVFLDQPCPCGSNDFVFELLGRCDDILVIGGMNMHLSDVSHALGKISGLSPIFQLIAEKEGPRDLLRIRVETLEDLDQKVTYEKLLSVLKHEAENIYFSMTSDLIRIRLELLKQGEIERQHRTGKIKMVIDRRK